MWEVLKYDDLRQQVPAFLYTRLLLGAPYVTYYFNPTIDIGYTYLLRAFNYKSSFSFSVDSTGYNEPRIKFVRSARFREKQNTWLPMDLLSTPGLVAGNYRNAAAAVDQDIFGLAANALPQVKNRIILNYFYQRNETIECLIRNVDTIRPSGNQYVDIMLEGYFLPDKKLAQWQ